MLVFASMNHTDIHLATLSSLRSLPPACATRLWSLHETYIISPALWRTSSRRTCLTQRPGTGALKPAFSGLHPVLCVRYGHTSASQNPRADLTLRWTSYSRRTLVLASSKRQASNLSEQPEPGIWTARRAARRRLLCSKWRRLLSEVRKRR